MALSNQELLQIEYDKLRTEGNKLLHDTMKQLITISSGSILIMIALLEKLFNSPRWKFLVAVAFLGFLICTISSLVMMRTISLNVGASYEKSTQNIERPARRVAYTSFLLAVAALVVFVVVNLQLG
jgi:hypothetical protein